YPSSPLYFPTRRSSDLFSALARSPCAADVSAQQVVQNAAGDGCPRLVATLSITVDHRAKRSVSPDSSLASTKSQQSWATVVIPRSEEHTSELQSRVDLV